MPKTIHFSRHGESEANANDIVAGTLDVPLTPKGYAEAERLAATFAAMPRADLVVTSKLQRAAYTAGPVANRHGLPLEEWEELHEVGFGSGEGGPRFTQGEPNALERLGLGLLPGAETLSDLEGRAQACWERLAALPGETIIVVGHASFTAIMFAVREGVPKEGFVEYRKAFKFENCEVKSVML